MKPALATPAMGLFLLATGFFLVGGGAAALMGLTHASLWVLCATAFAGACCAIAGACVGAAKHPVVVLAGVVLMPLVAFPAFFAILNLQLVDSGWAWAFIVAGLVAFALSLVGLMGSEDGSTATAH